MGVLLFILAPLSAEHSQIRVPATSRERASPRRASVFAIVSSSAPRRQEFLVGHRSEFAPGACVAFAPTGRDRHRTVFLDPGHGGPDPGAVATAPNGTLLSEKVLTLAVARATLPLLRADGYRVVLSRMQDGPVVRLRSAFLDGGAYTLQGAHADIEARVDCANEAHAQLLLAIHFNSFGDPSVGGVETAYDAVRPFRRENRRFADLVQHSVLARFRAQGWNVPDRLVLPDSELGTPPLSPQDATYGHLLELGPPAPGLLARASAMPGALCEALFLTNPAEAQIAAGRQGQHVLAKAFAQAFQEYFRPSLPAM